MYDTFMVKSVHGTQSNHYTRIDISLCDHGKGKESSIIHSIPNQTHTIHNKSGLIHTMHAANHI